jgi:lipopolysaccharide transport system permease protein
VRTLGALLRLLHPGASAQAFREVTRLLLRNRTLTAELTRRDIRGEHAGQIFGAAWGVIQPLAMMALYAFIFSVVFRVRVGGTLELPRDYTVYLLSGLIPWLACVQAMGKSTTAVTDSGNLVKQTVFTLELVPITRALASALPLVVGLAFVLVYMPFAEGGVPWTLVLVPLLVAFQALAMAGLALGLSAVGAFVRDLKQVIPIVALLGIFVLPVVYLPSSVPELFRPVLYLNPFSYLVWTWQDALYYGRFEHPWAWAVFLAGSVFLFVSSYRLFRKLKPYFGDVL